MNRYEFRAVVKDVDGYQGLTVEAAKESNVQFKTIGLYRNVEILGRIEQQHVMDFQVTDLEVLTDELNDLLGLVNQYKMKDDIEKELINFFAKNGMDLPENWEDIVQYCYEDILETADPDNWHSGDVMIAFRRWIESK